MSDNPWKYYIDCVEINGFRYAGVTENSMEDCYLNVKDRELYLPTGTYRQLVLLISAQKSWGHPMFLRDIDGKIYSLFGVNKRRNANRGEIITYEEIIKSDSFIQSRIEKEKTTYCKFFLEYPVCLAERNNFKKFAIAYNENLSIAIDEGQWVKDETSISVEIESKRPDNLLDYAYYIIELIYLIWGRMPIRGSYEIKHNDKIVTIYEDLGSEYAYNESITENNELALQEIKEDTLTSDLLKRYINYREKDEIRTRIDAFLDAANSGMNNNNACVAFIDILDSYGKERAKNDLSLTRTKSRDGDLDLILKTYYIGGTLPYIKDVFKCTQNDDVDEFVNNLKELRNIHSHYSWAHTEKFNECEYCSIKVRLELIIRLIILQELNIKVDDKLFKKTMGCIEIKEQEEGYNLIKKKNQNTATNNNISN